jgi:uncharacterized protein (DUF885 family)
MAPVFMSPFLFRADSQATDTALQAPPTAAITDIISKEVNPALEMLARFLEEEAERSSDSLGLGRWAGGAEHYAALLRYHSTIEISPEAAHAIGIREVTRLAAKAAAARDDARLPVNRDSLRAVFARDTAFVFTERNSIPARTARIFEDAATDLDSLFGPLPIMALSIGEMTGVSETSPLAVYDLPNMNRPSARYLLNIEELLSRSSFVLPGLVASDLMPGLHLQQGTQLQNEELPAFRRLARHEGFVKGWGLYALDVADSLSRKLSPRDRFSLRMRELAAACGLVVDTGINWLGWSRAQALAFLRAYLPDDDEDLERDFIFPSAERPGELSAATLGARELRGLRLWAMRESGPRFSLRDFHAELLRVGSVPLPVLGAHLERWIWDLNHPTPPAPVRR